MDALNFLSAPWLGQSVGVWLGFLTLVVVLLAFDLGVLHRKTREIGVRESLLMSGFYILVACAYGAWVWATLGGTAGMAFFTGFAIEKSLALDNIFVISLIFTTLAIPRAAQHRVLFWGILGVIVLRGIMIALGAAIVTQFDWVMLLFGAFLVVTGVRMLFAGDHEADVSENKVLKFLRRRLRVTDELHGQRFFVTKADAARGGQLQRYATPLFLALILVELADLVFAVDSIPAIFAITQEPFIVYTSNIFAILGLRALFFALGALLHRFTYLKYALSLVLVFIGGKVFYTHFFGKMPPVVSLSITLGLLAAGVLFSLWRTRGEPRPESGSPSH
ncbi:TerC family protein [Deinococcus maricopensis]|uniref:Integral membrane protein, TerC family n=1 Tax=Deinococcus maricopensis (strain DSM 21211 / LMG 22137 / NRRL B-23946 / LB-34) TaxID=709986 RepID=E8U4S4_DEIML|nr:TerC family protein [Deinococcus maricopensis]ADV66063.1 integral membrane protein, TerC family [Deinococcus maricopensis DSM 21211]